MSTFLPALLLAVVALAMWWWHRYGLRQVEGRCWDCQRSVETCSCIDVVFEPWDDDEDEAA